ncbi:unnamed protein product [Trifolium pratense]|uniref:Uncharacterized protein n=1 Tax=Trifolium pratense TaxID=57577 RepID=A0ACB0K5A6_TRIPR|nr:unnamed protein product [Trifolium pratense]
MLEINGGNSHNYDGLEVEDLNYYVDNRPGKMRTIRRITLKKVASLSAPKQQNMNLIRIGGRITDARNFVKEIKPYMINLFIGSGKCNFDLLIVMFEFLFKKFAPSIYSGYMFQSSAVGYQFFHS